MWTKKIEAKIKQIFAESRLKVKQTVKQNSRAESALHNNSGKRDYSGVPGGIRTHDPLLRRQPLCPTELQGLEAKSQTVGDKKATEFLFTPGGSTSSNSAIASSCIPSIIWL